MVFYVVYNMTMIIRYYILYVSFFQPKTEFVMGQIENEEYGIISVKSLRNRTHVGISIK